MAAPSSHAQTARRPSPPQGGFLGVGLYRSGHHRLIAGVAGGLGMRLGIDASLVRIAFVLLSLCGGVGLLAYFVLWAVLPEDDGTSEEREPGLVRAVSMAMVVAGTMLLLGGAGLWFGNTIALSIGMVAMGIGVVWLRTDASERERIKARLSDDPLEAIAPGFVGKLRLVLGGLLFSAGVAIFLARTNALNAAPGVVFAVGVTITGLAIVAGPWGWRLVRQLAVERRERIRSEERAEMAAHLHDSVLQTLALIQRTDQPREMLTLARNQERELRAWLNGTSLRSDSTVAGAIEQIAAAVELQFKIPVEVVTVGDAPVDERAGAILEAGREAILNAAKHSGADSVSVYLEVEDGAITAYVRDEGVGFDPAAVATDRRGMTESIRGRMERFGGSATVTSDIGAGSEVQLVLPRMRA
ncbi:MAG: PspC domain-containing protein [Actinobacteria bacterium]|nr:PspC domain-containing protein [Actinomycetota bacterium]